MNIMSYQGESSVTEVTNRIYTRLTPRQRERAEAAILKANPQLANIRAVSRGTVLRVPDIPELHAKRKNNPENPKTRFDKQMTESIAAFSRQFAEQTSSEQEETKAQLVLLKNRQFKKAITNKPHLKKQATSLTRSLTTRSAEVKERDKAVQLAVKQMLENL